jgi:c(7)-type cytochrome triheme protein
MTIHPTTLRIAPLLLALALGLAGAARADGLQKLPPDLKLPSGEGSPGTVTFSHGSHVDPKQPGCTNCHPRLFKILEKASTSNGQPIKHERMEQGQQCGACHGKTAFNFESCDMCHR